jgi:hypothetical protein
MLVEVQMPYVWRHSANKTVKGRIELGVEVLEEINI